MMKDNGIGFVMVERNGICIVADGGASEDWFKAVNSIADVMIDGGITGHSVKSIRVCGTSANRISIQAEVDGVRDIMDIIAMATDGISRVMEWDNGVEVISATTGAVVGITSPWRPEEELGGDVFIDVGGEWKRFDPGCFNRLEIVTPDGTAIVLR